MVGSVFQALALSSTSSSEEEEEDIQPKTKQQRVQTPSPARIPKPQNKTLRVLTYNVLADHLCRPNWFPYRKKDELDWKSRRECLKQTILSANASIVCLQEIQTFVGPVHLSANQNHNVWFDEFLRQEGNYAGVYGSRMNGTGKESHGVQIGNMVYFKQAEFTPLATVRNVSLLKTIHQAATGDKDVRKLYCHSGVRGTVATFVALECKTSLRRFLVVTTHLPAPRSDTDYNSALEQVLHAIALLVEIASFCDKTRVDFIICAGDLNAMPNGNVCELLRTGQLSAAKLKRILRLAQQSKFPQGFLSNEDGGVRIPDILLRAPHAEAAIVEDMAKSFFHNALMSNGVGLEFTNKTNIFTGWLDHVFILAGPDAGGVDLGRIRVEEASQECKDFFLPNPALGFGSDHLPVLCELHLSPYHAAASNAAMEGEYAKTPVKDLSPANGGGEDQEIVHILGDSQVFAREFSTCKCLGFKVCGDLRRIAPRHLFIAIKAREQDVVYMFDLKEEAILPALRQVMEDASVTKITFDSRLDSDVLFHNFAYRLRNVLDLQVYMQAVEFATKENYAVPESTQSWFPFLPNLERAKTKHLLQSDLELLKRAKPTEAAWSLENAIALDFVASQLVSYDYILRSITAPLPRTLAEQFDSFCQYNLRRFRDYATQVDFAIHRKLMLEEISIKAPIPDQAAATTTEEESYWEEWVKAGLISVLA